MAKDEKGKHVGGSVYQFAFTITGQFQQLANSSGKVLYRDRGKFSFNYMVDLATGEFTDLGVTLHGPHPIFEMGVCKPAERLTGSESGRYLTARPIGSTTFPMGFYEYLPPSYSATGVKSPLLIALNGYGENGDGHRRGSSEPPEHRHPAIHRRRRLAHEPPARRARAPACRESAV